MNLTGILRPAQLDEAQVARMDRATEITKELAELYLHLDHWQKGHEIARITINVGGYGKDFKILPPLFKAFRALAMAEYLERIEALEKEYNAL